MPICARRCNIAPGEAPKNTTEHTEQRLVGRLGCLSVASSRDTVPLRACWLAICRGVTHSLDGICMGGEHMVVLARSAEASVAMTMAEACVCIRMEPVSGIWYRSGWLHRIQRSLDVYNFQLIDQILNDIWSMLADNYYRMYYIFTEVPMTFLAISYYGQRWFSVQCYLSRGKRMRMRMCSASMTIHFYCNMIYWLIDYGFSLLHMAVIGMRKVSSSDGIHVIYIGWGVGNQLLLCHICSISIWTTECR